MSRRRRRALARRALERTRDAAIILALISSSSAIAHARVSTSSSSSSSSSSANRAYVAQRDESLYESVFDFNLGVDVDVVESTSEGVDDLMRVMRTPTFYAEHCACAEGLGSRARGTTTTGKKRAEREEETEEDDREYARRLNESGGDEKRARRKGFGADYRGFKATTSSGRACARWRHTSRRLLSRGGYSSSSSSSSFGPMRLGFDRGTGDNENRRGTNFCRNPSLSGWFNPWCYVDDENREWEYCDEVPSCRDAEALERYCAAPSSSTTEFCVRVMKNVSFAAKNMCASSPYAIYDDIAELIRGLDPTSPLLDYDESTGTTTVTDKFASTLAEIVGLTTPCEPLASIATTYSSSMCPELASHFGEIPVPTHDVPAMRRNIAKLSLGSIISRRQIVEVPPSTVLAIRDFLIARLPAAAFSRVVTVGDQTARASRVDARAFAESGWSMHSARDIVRLFDRALLQEQRVSCVSAHRIPLCALYAAMTSLTFCAANALAEYVADVGYNGLHLGDDYQYSERVSRMLLSYDRNRDVANFIVQKYPESVGAFNRVVCHLNQGEKDFMHRMVSTCQEFAKSWAKESLVYTKLIGAFAFDDGGNPVIDGWIDCSRYDFDSMKFDGPHRRDSSAVEIMYEPRYISMRAFALMLAKMSVVGVLMVFVLSRLAARNHPGGSSYRAGASVDEVDDYDEDERRSMFGVDSAGDNDMLFHGSTADQVSYLANGKHDDTRVGRYVRLKHRGYRILDEIGRGGNGVVYLASVQEEASDRVNFDGIARLVAVKEPHNKYKAKLEISLLESMAKNEYLCEYLGAVVDSSSRTWMMMFELCQHGSLRACLKAGTYPRGGEVIYNAIDMMLKGVKHVHASKIAHRDIKMENFLVACQCENYCGTRLDGRCRRDHVIKIADLGLAKNGDMMYDTSAQFTGTLCYVAPERLSILPGKISPETYELADLYGVGLAAWELMYYAKVGVARSVLDDVFNDENDERPTLSEAQMMLVISTGGMKPTIGHLSPRVSDWIQSTTAFNPVDRFKSLAHAQKAFQRLRGDFIRDFIHGDE